MNTLPATGTAGDLQEAGSLAQELEGAFKRLVEHYRVEEKLSPLDAVAKAKAVCDGYLASVLKGPADQVSWRGLSQLAAKDPEAAARRWEQVKAQALLELQSGHRAAKAMEGSGSHCWSRAQFLAVRRELLDGWPPRNGIERQLIEMMAQAQTGYLHWLDLLTMRCASDSMKREEGRWQAPTVEDVEAMEQAAAMVERFQGMFLRTLKALRDLRRTPGVFVQSAGQVNVGQQQVNVSGGNRPAPGAVTVP